MGIDRTAIPDDDIDMRITISLDRRLVKRARILAADRDTTLNSLIRQHLESLAPLPVTRAEQKRRLEALKHTFDTLQVNIGKRTWKREDLYRR